MKKKIYMEMVCFSILLVLLSTITLSGCGIFHWKGKIPDYEEQSYHCLSSSEIHDIVIDNHDVLIEVCNSENEEIYFSYYLADDKSNLYKIAEKDGKLSVKNKCKPNYGIFIFGDEYTSDSYKDVKLKLFIPYDYDGKLSLKTLEGNINIYDILVGNLEIETQDGDVIFKDTEIKERLYCHTQDGDIEGTLKGKLSEYNFKTVSSDGESNINSSSKGNKTVDLITKDGDIHVSFHEYPDS